MRYVLAAVATMASLNAPADEVKPGILRTPDDRFENLPGYPFAPHYIEIAGYRVHYVDEGPRDGEVVILFHGEPSWSYLYRKMIPVLVDAGCRCIAPDLIGFGKSDKPVDRSVHTYKFHVDSMSELVQRLDLKNTTLFGQDWGGLIGLRVLAENESRFARIVVANTGLPVGDGPPSPGFMAWRRMAEGYANAGDMPIENLFQAQLGSAEAAQAYAAPFPDPSYKAGPLAMPLLVPISPDDPASEANKRAWKVLEAWQKPLLTAFSDGDPITRGGDAVFQARVPGAKGQPHTTLKDAGHFLQEAKGEELAKVIADFIAATPVAK